MADYGEERLFSGDRSRQATREHHHAGGVFRLPDHPRRHAGPTFE